MVGYRRFKQIWKPSKGKERYVKVGLTFSNCTRFVVRIRFLYGLLNIGIENATIEGDQSAEALKAIASSAPILVPATPGPSSHEDHLALAQVHRLLNIREPNRVIRNVLLRLQSDKDSDAFNFVQEIVTRYFGTKIGHIDFDDARDLEIRAPLNEADYEVDLVSAGSGLNQILQLAAIIAWRRPGIVLLDEPDAHLHSSVQAQLLDFLSELVTKFRLQVILATHSKDLIGRAPLESIVPVDRTRRKLEPLASVEHLLLEYQRQGTVSNVDLALLYQTKRCFFVEGPTDTRLLPRIAERLKLPAFVGRDQVVLFEFAGFENLKLLPNVVSLFERLIGGSLRWGALRDSDANVPEVKAKYAELAKHMGVPHYHQWSRYSLENYLIEPNLLLLAIQKRDTKGQATIDNVNELLDRAVDRVEREMAGPFITKTQTAYRTLELAENPFDEGASVASQYMRSLATREQKLSAYSGKRIFGAFVESLQSDFGVNIRLDDIVSELTPDNAPHELKEVLEKLNEI